MKAKTTISKYGKIIASGAATLKYVNQSAEALQDDEREKELELLKRATIDEKRSKKLTLDNLFGD